MFRKSTMENYIIRVNSLIVPSCAKGDCNTIKSPSRTVHPSIKWGFTLNNYDDSKICAIKKKIVAYCRFGIFSKEVGELGTPHLQGYFEFRKKRRPIGVFGIKEMHFDKKHGTRDDNVRYVVKDGPAFFQHPAPYVEKIFVMYEWEIYIMKEILDKPINPRSIYWFYETIGNAGKTTFMKWIFSHYKRCVVVSGKATDMKNGIVNYYVKNKFLPSIVLIDIPRATNVNWISIPGIEEIKNMFFFSGKYEGGMVCGNPPHLLIMANQPPIREKMSADRWKVFRIQKEGGYVEEKVELGYEQDFESNYKY